MGAAAMVKMCARRCEKGVRPSVGEALAAWASWTFHGRSMPICLGTDVRYMRRVDVGRKLEVAPTLVVVHCVLGPDGRGDNSSWGGPGFSIPKCSTMFPDLSKAVVCLCYGGCDVGSSPLFRKVLSLASDQGPDAYCAKWYLKGPMRIALMDFDDPSHGVQADIKQSTLHTQDLWPRLLLNSVAFQVDWGPFASSNWYHKIQESGCAYLQKASCADPLFQWLLPRISKDMGLEDQLDSPDAASQIYEEVFRKAVLAPKGARLQMSRFMALIDVSAERDKTWHSRLAVLLHMGIELGYVKKLSRCMDVALRKPKVGLLKGGGARLRIHPLTCWLGGAMVVAPG